LDREVKSKRLLLLEEFKQKHRNELEAQRQRLQELALKAGAPDGIKAQHEYLSQSMAHVSAEVLRVRNELLGVEAELLTKRVPKGTKDEPRISEAALEAEVQNDPAYQELERTIQQTKISLSVVEKTLGDGKEGYAGLRALRSRQKILEENLEKLRQDLRPRLRVQLTNRAQRDQESALSLLRERKSHLDYYKKMLEEELQVLRTQGEKLNVSQVSVEALQKNVASLEKLADLFESETTVLRVEIAAPPRVAKNEDATADWGVVEGKRMKIAGVAACLGLLAGVGLVVIRESRHRRVEGIKDVEHDLGLPLVGLLPRNRRTPLLSSVSGDLETAGGVRQLTDCIDMLRARLLDGNDGDRLRVLMVTSAVTGEGKTSISCHLAASIARSGRRTLLIDGDMRRPSVHQVFQTELEPGLAEILRAESEVHESIRGTRLEGLSLLPAGRWDPRTGQALCRSNFSTLLTGLRSEFDFILLDSAPVLSVVDSLLLGRHCDGALFAVQHGVSQIEVIQFAGQRLAEMGIRMLGAVLNGSSLNSYGYESNHYS
jgi:capsular exopolysaccharide synthesis family protein